MSNIFPCGNDIEEVNVGSVRNLIGFCERTGAALVHVSTVSVAGQSVNGYPDRFCHAHRANA